MLSSLAPHTTPEIQRTALEELVLQLLSLRLGGGVAAFMGSLIDPPPPAAPAMPPRGRRRRRRRRC